MLAVRGNCRPPRAQRASAQEFPRRPIGAHPLQAPALRPLARKDDPAAIRRKDRVTPPTDSSSIPPSFGSANGNHRRILGSTSIVRFHINDQFLLRRPPRAAGIEPTDYGTHLLATGREDVHSRALTAIVRTDPCRQDFVEGPVIALQMMGGAPGQPANFSGFHVALVYLVASGLEVITIEKHSLMVTGPRQGARVGRRTGETRPLEGTSVQQHDPPGNLGQLLRCHQPARRSCHSHHFVHTRHAGPLGIDPLTAQLLHQFGSLASRWAIPIHQRDGGVGDLFKWHTRRRTGRHRQCSEEAEYPRFDRGSP